MMALRPLGPAFAGLLVLITAPPDAFFETSLAQAPSPYTALTGARLIDGTGSAPIDRATLIVRNGRVETAGPGTAVSIPAGATRIDLSGKTIVPGFINAHAHVNAADEAKQPIRDQLVRQLRLYADYGVTTAIVLGSGAGDVREALSLRDEQERTTLDRARIFVCSPSAREVTTVEQARQRASRDAEMKVDCIKIHINGNANDMKPEVYGTLIGEAHKRGLRVAAHLYYSSDAWGLLKAGVDVFAHSVRDKDIDPAMIAELKRRNVSYIPTLTRDLSVFVYETTPPFFSDPFFLRHVADYRAEMTPLLDPAQQERTRANKQAQAIKQALEQASRNVKILSDAGASIAMGTDTGAGDGRWQGYFEHVELELMVKAGLTPMQALVAATSGAARSMKLDDRLGTLQAGKWADFLVLNADPLADIRNTRQLDSVWIGGRRQKGT
jgi:imidazolonepropionase-like amidohydrolase